MSNYKEIVTKAVIGKGKKTFISKNEIKAQQKPSTILGCWVINHTFSGTREDDSVKINGGYDVNIWYSYDNDTKTDLLKEHKDYQEVVNIRAREDSDESNEEVIVRSLKQPSCISAKEKDNSIIIDIEKELGVEIVGDTKVKIAIEEDEEPWDEIPEEVTEEDLKDIEDNVDPDYLKEEK